MSVFSLFQIQLSEEETNIVNKMGWHEAVTMFPRIGVYLEFHNMTTTPESLDPNDFCEFTKVCQITVDTDESVEDQLEHCFHVGNGYEMENVTILRGYRMASMSAGDILTVRIEGGNTQYWFCAAAGWRLLHEARSVTANALD